MRKHALLFCCAQVLLLCYAQIHKNRILILLCLGLFLVQAAYTSVHSYELPVLLFYLPWTALLRFSPGSVSFYTLALLMIGCIKIIKNKFMLQNYYVAIALAIAVLSLLAKIISGYRPANSYLMFLAMLVLFPALNFENRAYNFYWLTVFFSLGIVIAALMAERFAGYPNIAEYIKVDSYLSITRRCGFYGDPNFYTAHITAAIAACLVLIVDGQRRGESAVLLVLTGILVYCGFLSGSKSFFLIWIFLMLLWVIEICLTREKITRKAALILSLVVFLVYIASSSLFRDKIDTILTRFSWANNTSEFTTGRTDLWRIYLTAIFDSPKLLFLGQGFTNVLIAPKASHNTLIQLVYQFGIFGGALLMAWQWGLCQEVVGDQHLADMKVIRTAMLGVGAILPWIAVDILFFDELFLIPAYVFVGIKELCSKQQNM